MPAWRKQHQKNVIMPSGGISAKAQRGGIISAKKYRKKKA